MFGICFLSNIPLRFEPSDKSEMVSQILFGEFFEIIETQKQWRKIKLWSDQYVGWIDEKQMTIISEESFQKLTQIQPVFCTDLVDFVQQKNGVLLPILLGSNLSFLTLDAVNVSAFVFEGQFVSGKKAKQNLVETAFLFENTPYLWGGKTPFGIDCSGFTQMVYKLNGYDLLRDASQQAQQGEPLSFIEESEPGDLAFFDNEEGNIIHVGIMMKDNYIIHASGKVRIDRLDHLGIYNETTRKHTHQLRVIKRIF